MCGICGMITTREPPDLRLLTTMMSHLVHRGPDGCGYYRDRWAALGHTRLAIIDRIGGAQPLANADGSLWVAYNGEIFNYLELREDLTRAGHRFRTVSDTEVIVHAWEEWGPECFTRFNGQWAIALWDSARRRLILSRDRLGVRPLYYAEVRGGLRFASEIKALFADPEIDREFDPTGLGEIFTFWSTVAPRTPFLGVRRIPPGHYAVYDGRSLEIKPYWRIEFPAGGGEARQDMAHNAKELRELLLAATLRRFERSDVPVGAYLSGGLDSAITAALIAQHAGAPVHTFSLRFHDPEFDEGCYQHQLAAALGTAHQEITVGPAEIAEIFPEVIRHTETPLVRAAPAPLFLLSKSVADAGCRVVVTGEGADEVLAGYDIFREARVRMFWGRNRGSPLRARALELLYPWMVRSPSQAPAFARSFFGSDLDLADPALSHRPRWNSTRMIQGMLMPDLAEAGADLAVGLPDESADWDPLSRAQWLEMTTLLPGYILASQGDRMLMANSVEGRFPFLDHEIVEFAGSVPAHHKLFGLEEKYLLKRAFQGVIPDEILHRPKQPYRAPDASCFVTESPLEWVSDLTSDAELTRVGVFDPRRVVELFAKARRVGGRRMSNTDNMRILAVVSTQLTYAELTAGAWRTAGALPEISVREDRIEVNNVT